MKIPVTQREQKHVRKTGGYFTAGIHSHKTTDYERADSDKYSPTMS